MLGASLRAIPSTLALCGLFVTIASIVAAGRASLPPIEKRVFHAVNGLPDWLFVPLWVPMQFGNLVVGALAGFAIALWRRDASLAIAVLVATLSKFVIERVIRRRMAAFARVRQRPGASEDHAILRGGDVPASGASFPSGHVILASAIASVLSSSAGATWVWLPWLVAVLVMIGRVYVGAHNPLDVTAGLGAGMLIGGLLDLVLR